MKNETKLFFGTILKRGSLLHEDHLSLKYLVTQPPHIKVVVSKKVTGKAVSRNLLKRRITHVFKKHTSDLQGIFFAKKGAGSLSFPTLEIEVTTLIKRALQ